MANQCLGGSQCKHKKCECGHCKSYHLWNRDVCQQLDRATLKTCPCKRFTKLDSKGDEE